ncbi:MAG: Npun_R2821/Npun_R2822 family protein [Cyanobacterium sp.]
MKGIYTLANDVVVDQLIALLNSIRKNIGDIPVAVIAYSDQLSNVKKEIKRFSNVELIDDFTLFEPWRHFSQEVWKAHPTAFDLWKNEGIKGVYRISCNHRYFAFDSLGLFDQFIYFDADVLTLNSVNLFFDNLNSHDLVIYDFQHKDVSHIFNVKSDKLFEVFSESKIRKNIFCSGCFAGNKGIFSEQDKDLILQNLGSGDAEILYLGAPNQSVLNYMAMTSQKSIYNLALELPPEQKTGNSVTSPHFEYKDNLLYDKGVRLTYLHYIGVPSSVFTRLCAGENLDFPYRDIFLHYRYLHEPEKMPKFVGKPKPYNPPPTFIDKVFRKLGVKTKK